MFLLAGFQVFCARVANTLLTSWSPLTYELGDYSDGTEKLDPDYEPCPTGAVDCTCIPAEPTTVDDEPKWPSCARCDKRLGEIAASSKIVGGMFCSRYCVTGAEVDHFAHQDATVGNPNIAVATHDHAAGVEAPTPPAAFKLPMFEFTDLQAIASDYLVNHFPWPDGDGKFGCTCGTQGFTIATWSEHVSELQVSETVYYLTGLLYDQTQQK